MSSAPVVVKDYERAGSDEITLREPQYVFAVNDCLMVIRHSEENEFADCFKVSYLAVAKKICVVY